MTGGGVDIEDVIAERKRELEMFDEADIDVEKQGMLLINTLTERQPDNDDSLPMDLSAYEDFN